VVVCIAILLGVVAFATSMPGHAEKDASLTYATWALTLVTLLLALGVPLTILDSSKKAREQEQDQFYAQLDGMYLEIQKLVIEHPHLGDPTALSSDAAKPEHVMQYDAFAFVVWNFIESIYDFTRNSEDPRLTETWQCIIDYEGERHVRWFVQPQNVPKFKPAFREGMKDKLRLWTARLPPASTT